MLLRWITSSIAKHSKEGSRRDLPPDVEAVTSPRLSLTTPDVDLGPLKFVPHDGGFFSNFNFLIGEMYAGRTVYPLFAPDEIAGWEGELRQFAYAASDCENSWFSFFKPLAYYDGDKTHGDTQLVKALPATW